MLITGFSGTAKTTLSGAFAEAACRRGERTLFVSFDSDSNEVIRNLASVGIRLDRYVKNGCLRMISARAISSSAETYLVRIKTVAEEHRARCLVIDPVSTWSKSGNDLTAQSVAERLIDGSKANGTTLLCTRLLDEMSSPAEGGSPLQISTVDGILMTPTLVKLAPSPVRRIVGTLSQTQPVLQALGLETFAA